MSIQTDTEGRLYLPAELREEYGEKFHIVRYDDRLELIPIADDPLAAVREAVGDAFEGKSAAELKEEALAAAQQEARNDLKQPDQETGNSGE
jgi:hypothetical protein